VDLNHPQLAKERKAYIKARLARWRKDEGLSQTQVAEKLGVTQPAVAKWERDGTAPEEVLTKLWSLYGKKESYPSAPKDPERRRAYFDERNALIQQNYRPRTAIIGAGVPPKGAA
jgi:transcriptional regulator with XRE-family HTH domain